MGNLLGVKIGQKKTKIIHLLMINEIPKEEHYLFQHTEKIMKHQ